MQKIDNDNKFTYLINKIRTEIKLKHLVSKQVCEKFVNCAALEKYINLGLLSLHF